MPAFFLDKKAHVGYPLSSDGKKTHAIAPSGLKVRRDGDQIKIFGTSLCDRKVEVRDRDEVFDRVNPGPDVCKRCVVIARSMNGSFADAA